MKAGRVMLFGAVAITIGVRLLTAPLPAADDATRPDVPAELRSEALAMVLATVSGTPGIDERITALQRRIAAGDDHPATLERLGWAFVAKARAGNDAGYYRVAEACAAALEDRSGDDSAMRAGALLLRGHVLQSLHRFSEAETIARRALAQRSTPQGHALLGDALLDQGRLREAVVAYEQMMELRPDANAYSRAAEVRFLTGDIAGAGAAMDRAIAAAGSDREARAWMYSRRAWFALHDGRLDAARADAARAVELHAGSAAAHSVLGRIDMARGDFAGAAVALRAAAALAPSVEAFWLLAEACRAAGDDACAHRADAGIARHLGPGDRRASAAFLAETGGDASAAIALAAEELTRRRDVYTLDAMAAAHLAAGDCEPARSAITQALAGGIRDGRLFLHAGQIAAMCGDAAEAGRQFVHAAAHEHVLMPGQRQRLRRMPHAATPIHSPQYQLARRTQ